MSSMPVGEDEFAQLVRMRHAAGFDDLMMRLVSPPLSTPLSSIQVSISEETPTCLSVEILSELQQAGEHRGDQLGFEQVHQAHQGDLLTSSGSPTEIRLEMGSSTTTAGLNSVMLLVHRGQVHFQAVEGGADGNELQQSPFPGGANRGPRPMERMLRMIWLLDSSKA
jgi:hypothetical protein